MDPTIPRAWPSFELCYRRGETTYTVRVENPDGVCRGVRRVEQDGAVLAEGTVPLMNDGQEHQVRLILGPNAD